LNTKQEEVKNQLIIKHLACGGEGIGMDGAGTREFKTANMTMEATI